MPSAAASRSAGMTFYLTLFRQSQGTFQGLFDNINQLYENGLFMDNLFSFLKLTPQMPVAEQPVPMPRSASSRGSSFDTSGSATPAARTGRCAT